MKSCYTLVNYFSEKYNSIQSATFVCYNEDQTKSFIQNSGEKIWIDTEKLTIKL
jgi:hypothetical protein